MVAHIHIVHNQKMSVGSTPVLNTSYPVQPSVKILRNLLESSLLKPSLYLFLTAVIIDVKYVCAMVSYQYRYQILATVSYIKLSIYIDSLDEVIYWYQIL